MHHYILSDSAQKVVDDISQKLAISKDNVIRSSLITFEFVVRHLQDGWKINLHKDGQTKELKYSEG